MAIFTTIGAAVATALGVAGTAVGTFIAGATAFGLQVAAGIGVSLIAQAIAGKKLDNVAERASFSVQGKLQAGGDLPRSFIIGWGCTAGSLVYANTWGEVEGTPNAYLTQVIALTDLPVSGMEQVWVNGELGTLDDTPHESMGYPVLEYQRDGADHLWVKFYDGTQTTADSFLTGTVSSESRPWESTRVGVGIAYAIVTARVNEELFTGFPTFKFALNGIPLYDPSDSEQSWASPGTWGGDGDHLPVVQIYNLLRGIAFDGKWFYGLQGMSGARLPTDDWVAQIEKCRDLIDGPDGDEPTYRTGGEIRVNAPIADAIEAILTGCQGRLAEIGGSYKIHVGEPGSPVASFTDDDIISTEEQSFTPFFGLADTITGISAKHPSPSEGWAIKVAPPLYRSDLEELAGNRRLMADVSLDLVPYPGQVQRLVQSALAEAQRARRHTFVLPPKFWVLEPGDIVSWTSVRNGYISKLFRVDGVVDKANLDVMVDITEVDPEDYDWDQDVDYRTPIDGRVGPVRPPPQVMTGWEAHPYTIDDGNGTPRRPAIEVRYPGSHDDVRAVRIQARVKATAAMVFDGEAPYGPPAAGQKSHVLSAQFVPNVEHQARGILVPYSGRATEWSEWLDVTTPNVGLTDVDFALSYQEWTRWIGEDMRELIDGMRQLPALAADQDYANYADKQELRRELVSTYESATAKFTEDILAATGPTSALATRTTTLEAALEGYLQPGGVSERFAAQALTINAQTSLITAQGAALNIVAQDLTVVEAALDGYLGSNAVATAIGGLQSQVTGVGNDITAVANAVTSLSAATTPGNVATVNIRATVTSGPYGANSRYGWELRTGGSGSYRSASFFQDVPSNTALPVRTAINTEELYVFNSSTGALPFMIAGSNVSIRSLYVGTGIHLDGPNNRIVISD